MKAIILSAGYGKRLRPLTKDCPKSLLKINNETLLSNSINFLSLYGVKEIIINVHYLADQIIDYIDNNNFNLDIKIVNDGKVILNTGGGILNMIKSSSESDFLTFNPDTVWNKNYAKHIKNMEKFYFSNQIKNILLLVNKSFSFDKKLKGDFNLVENKVRKDDYNNLIYTGCQIINKDLFKSHLINNFSISEIWNQLVYKDELYGYESSENFYHLSNHEVYKELLKNK